MCVRFSDDRLSTTTITSIAPNPNGGRMNNGIFNLDIDLSSQLKQGIHFFTFNVGDETLTEQVIIE